MKIKWITVTTEIRNLRIQNIVSKIKVIWRHNDAIRYCGGQDRRFMIIWRWRKQIWRRRALWRRYFVTSSLSRVDWLPPVAASLCERNGFASLHSQCIGTNWSWSIWRSSEFRLFYIYFAFPTSHAGSLFVETNSLFLATSSPFFISFRIILPPSFLRLYFSLRFPLPFSLLFSRALPRAPLLPRAKVIERSFIGRRLPLSVVPSCGR